MNKVTLDPRLRSRLSGLQSEVEFCDERGNTVGYFVPAPLHDEYLYAWARSQVSEEELEKARRQVGGRPLADILARLERS